MAKILKEMSWIEVEEFSKECDFVIIPTGAVEVYGPHMPLGTDGIIAEEIAKRLSNIKNFLVAPTVDVGDSQILKGFPGTLSVEGSHFTNYLKDICDSLREIGFKKFLFITGHAGNLPSISYICKEYCMKYSGIKMAQVDWWRFASANSRDIFDYDGYMAYGHASECATSLMLHLRPELVKMEKAICHKLNEDQENKYPDIIQYFLIKDMTETGIIGDATIATAEKGEKLVDRCVNRIIEFTESYYKV